MSRIFTIVFTVLVILYPYNPAAAQQACGDRALFTNKLEQTFAERPVAMGLTEKGAVIEVFASLHGSWTFLITMPSGLTCVVASGQSWESLAVSQQDLAS